MSWIVAWFRIRSLCKLARIEATAGLHTSQPLPLADLAPRSARTSAVPSPRRPRTAPGASSRSARTAAASRRPCPSVCCRMSDDQRQARAAAGAGLGRALDLADAAQVLRADALADLSARHVVARRTPASRRAPRRRRAERRALKISDRARRAAPARCASRARATRTARRRRARCRRPGACASLLTTSFL